MATLDRNRPFGTVHGEGDKKWFYEQDGKPFDQQGNELADPGGITDPMVGDPPADASPLPQSQKGRR